jgi:hypothetical protein
VNREEDRSMITVWQKNLLAALALLGAGLEGVDLELD